MTSVAPFVQHARIEPAGYLLVCSAEPSLAATFRLIAHEGVGIDLSGEHRRLTFAKPGTAIWMAWYSPRVLSNGWEPYDQPHPSAYLPIGFRKLQRYQVPGQGVLLRQSRSESTHRLLVSEASMLVTCSGGSLRAEIEGLLGGLGLPQEHVTLALGFLLPASVQSGLPDLSHHSLGVV